MTFVALPLEHEGRNIELPCVCQPHPGRRAAGTQLGCLCSLPWDLTLVSFRPKHAGPILSSLPSPSLGICLYSWSSYTADPAACVFSCDLNPSSVLYWGSPEAFSAALLISVFPLSSCLLVCLSDFCVGNHRPSRTVLLEWTSQRNLPHFLNHLLWSKKMYSQPSVDRSTSTESEYLKTAVKNLYLYWMERHSSNHHSKCYCKWHLHYSMCCKSSRTHVKCVVS